MRSLAPSHSIWSEDRLSRNYSWCKDDAWVGLEPTGPNNYGDNDSMRVRGEDLVVSYHARDPSLVPDQLVELGLCVIATATS